MPLCDLTSSRGIKIYYEFHGPTKQEFKYGSESVLLLVGTADDLRRKTTQQYLRMMEMTWNVLTYDHRNTGQTLPILDRPLTMQDYADDAAELIKALLKDKLPIHVVGNSFGGAVAQHLAIRHPELVKKLVICCAATGGPGGSSYPLHELYVDGVSLEQRVERRLILANTSRDAKWRKENESEWQMYNEIVLRDEKIGQNDSGRKAGIQRQLEARQAHDVWDELPKLEMPVLCCSSSLDNICPTEKVIALASRIGENAETMLDFGWGHPLLAADVKAAPRISEWLRAKMKIKTEAAAETLRPGDRCVNLARSILRAEKDLESAQVAVLKKSTSMLLMTVEGTRGRVTADGQTGWVSLRSADGQVLVVKEGKAPNNQVLAPAAESAADIPTPAKSEDGAGGGYAKVAAPVATMPDLQNASATAQATDKKSEDLSPGDQCMNLARSIMRADKDLQSPQVATLHKSTSMHLEAIDGRRARVTTSDGQSGWISLRGAAGEVLVVKAAEVLGG